MESDLESEDIRKVFAIALNRLGITDEWKVEVLKNKASISVNQDKKIVQIPEDREDTLMKILGLVLHEIGTHIRRRVVGESSEVKLLGLGLDRYLPGEEGIATTKQQIHEDDLADFSGIDAHLAASLARGLDGVPRDFRGVFEITSKYYYLLNLLDKVSDPMGKANDKAWKYCLRVFRGTFCDEPGVCFTKDIAYREGNAGIWAYLEQNGKDAFKEFSIGKYDPANPRHRWILHQLGLQALESDELLSLEADLRSEPMWKAKLQPHYLDTIK